MAITPFKTWISGEVLTASDLNSSFSHITSNATSLISPLTAALDLNGLELILDVDADTSITADTDDKIDFKIQGSDLFILDGTTASAINGLTVTMAATGSGPQIGAHGSDTNIAVTLKGKGTGAVILGQSTSSEVRLAGDAPLTDSSGNELIKFSKTASAVNEFTITNAATAGRPKIAVTGGDTDVGLDLQLKGAGVFQLLDGNGNELLKTDAPVASAVNEITITNAATSTPPILSATGTDSNVGLRISPKGTGLLDIRNAVLDICDGRLTLTTGVPITTSNVTAATTVYFTPYRGDRVTLFDGTDKWILRNFTELSLTVPSTTNTMYDIFLYDNSGTLTLEAVAWTNDTTRATALVMQNGIYVKTGATARRYLGSFRTTGSSGQTEDSLAKRYLWNMHNRRIRPMHVSEATASWNYSTATYRQANNSTANQIDVVIGLSEDPVFAHVLSAVGNSTGTARVVYAGIGLDSTTDNSAQRVPILAVGGNTDTTYAEYCGFPGIGRHYLAWLEKGNGTDTQTWLGSTSGGYQSGITGEILG